MMGAIVCIVAFGGTLWKAHDYMENYALAEDLKQTNKRLDQKIMSDQLNQVQQRIWIIEDRAKVKPPDATAQEELRTLKDKKEELKKELDKK
jgi:hypothetical protein